MVDAGSSDRTVEVAEAAGAKVIVEKRRGYGRACATGAQAARSEVLAFLDGDGADDHGMSSMAISGSIRQRHVATTLAIDVERSITLLWANAVRTRAR